MRKTVGKLVMIAAAVLVAQLSIGCGDSDSDTSGGGSGGSGGSGGTGGTGGTDDTDDTDDGGDSLDDPPAFACQFSDGKQCHEYRGGTDSVIQSAKESCTDWGSIVERCPTADLIGTCAVESGGLGTTVFYYDNESASNLQQTCESNLKGVWKDG